MLHTSFNEKFLIKMCERPAVPPSVMLRLLSMSSMVPNSMNATYHRILLVLCMNDHCTTVSTLPSPASSLPCPPSGGPMAAPPAAPPGGKPRVVIIGAGPAGLCAAAALARQGCSVQVGSGTSRLCCHSAWDRLQGVQSRSNATRECCKRAGTPAPCRAAAPPAQRLAAIGAGAPYLLPLTLLTCPGPGRCLSGAPTPTASPATPKTGHLWWGSTLAAGWRSARHEEPGQLSGGLEGGGSSCWDDSSSIAACMHMVLALLLTNSLSLSPLQVGFDLEAFERPNSGARRKGCNPASPGR